MTTENQEKIFIEWLGEYKRLIFKVVRAYAINREDQDDLFQEILLGLWSSIPSYQRKAKETTWIYRVALNTALVWTRDKMRKKKRNKEMIANLERIAETANENCDVCETDRVIEQVYGAIHKLEKVDGSVILMWLDGLSYEQMAEVIGISKTNVGVKLNRARKRLAQLLKGLIDDV
jgi:RNA polymerase sigma-70 factor (ECF subfamily)